MQYKLTRNHQGSTSTLEIMEMKLPEAFTLSWSDLTSLVSDLQVRYCQIQGSWEAF